MIQDLNYWRLLELCGKLSVLKPSPSYTKQRCPSACDENFLASQVSVIQSCSCFSSLCRDRPQICWAWLIIHNPPLCCNAPVLLEQPCLSNIKRHYTLNKVLEKHSRMTSLFISRWAPVLVCCVSPMHGPG